MSPPPWGGFGWGSKREKSELYLVSKIAHPLPNPPPLRTLRVLQGRGQFEVEEI